MTDVWQLPAIARWEKSCGKHPTQKPVALLETFVELLSNEGEVVFDPFMGSGSTGVAALKHNRKFIGVDLNNEYCEIAEKRLEIACQEMI